MYKVIIVDDEPLLRFAVRNLLKWEDYGFTVVGEASDGMETLKLVRQIKPDLIFSDIRMPNMDGLEMVRFLKKESRARVVIMSNYDDFRYAQAALRLGVDDYVLKSNLNGEMLEKILRQERTRLDALQTIRIPDKEEKGIETVLKEIILRNGITADMDLSKWENAPLIKMKYITVVLSIVEKDYQHRMENSQMTMYQNFMENILRQKLNGKGCHFSVKDGESVIILPESDYENLGGKRLFAGIISLLERYSNRTFVVGVSGPRQGIQEFYSCYQMAFWAADRYFFEEGDKVLKAEGNVLWRDDELHGSLEKFFEMAGAVNWVTGMKRAILDMVEKIKNSRMPSARCKMILTNAIVFYEIRLTGEQGEGSRDDRIGMTKQIADRIDCAGTYEQLCREVEELLGGMAQYANDKGSYSLLVQQALKWIEEHYTEHITLMMAAEHLSTHPNHLSRAFSQQTGKSFSTYLNDYRMEKAKTLLLNRTLSVQEIGERVGISNGKYFSDVFKKWCGMAPREYRRMILKDDEGEK